MKLRCTILGSGTSHGVPVIGCSCPTCRSSDPRDNRLRPSVLIETDENIILIDTSSDFRQQMLRARPERLDAVLYTHHHFDHIGGFDDLRQFNHIQHGPVECYGLKPTLEEIRVSFRYAFEKDIQKGGGVPLVSLHEITPGVIAPAGLTVQAIPVLHGHLDILAYRVGDFAYLTDVSGIPEESYTALQGLEVLVLNALRHQRHPTHFNIGDAVRAAKRIGARSTFFTHMTHDVLHARDSELLPENIALAYDGLVIEI